MDESYKEAVISFKAIDINKLSTDDILIKYKGTGSGSDTWYNENVHVTFCFYR